MSAMYSHIVIVLVSKFGANLLGRSSKLFVNDTFQTTEYNLVLIILMVLVNEVAVSCTWMFSNSHTTSTYKTFFEIYYLLLHTIIITYNIIRK
jgi:hypothetical protein